MSKKNLWMAVAAFVGCFLATGIVISAGSVFADATGSEPVSSLVPYEGVIEQDGTPLDGPVTLRFSLYDGPVTTVASWVEDQEVIASRGRFSVALGATSSPKAQELAALIRYRRDLYLKIGVVDGGVETVLSGQQRLLPAPYALAAGDGFTTGQTTLGATSSGPLKVAGNLEVTGASLHLATEQGTADPQRAALTRDDATGALVVNPAGGFAGGTRVDGTLRVAGALEVPNPVEGNLTVSGELATQQSLTLDSAGAAPFRMKGLRTTAVYSVALDHPSYEQGYGKSNTVPMTSVAKSICFLTKQSHGLSRVWHADAIASDYRCEIVQDAGTWKLQGAISWNHHYGGHRITCEARCMEWDWD